MLPGILSEASLTEVRKALARKAANEPLATFVQLAWPEVESRPFQGNWHIGAICERLEAVNGLETRALIICVPPRHSKSLITTIFWPAWTWASKRVGKPLSGPRTSFAFGSWSATLSTDHNMTLRRLVDSPWYRIAAGDGFETDPRISRADDFRLTAGGRAFATSVNSNVTGWGFDIRVADDPHALQTIDSAADRLAVKRWYDEVWKSRVEDPKRSAEVIIMQRAHSDDLVGYILGGAREAEFEVLCLPAEYDPDHPQRWSRDRRKEPGELLDAKRFGVEGYATISPATQFAKSAQMQQLPVPRGGSVFRNADWQFADEAPVDLIRHVRYWDRAITPEGMGNDPDYTAGVLAGFDRRGRFWILDIQRGRWSSHQAEQRISFVAREMDPPGTAIWIELEPGSSGQDIVSVYQRHVLRGLSVRGDRATGEPVARVDPLVACAEAGNVVLLRREWNAAFLAECDTFTGEKNSPVHDDQVIAAAGAFKNAAASGRLTQAPLHGV